MKGIFTRGKLLVVIILAILTWLLRKYVLRDGRVCDCKRRCGGGGTLGRTGRGGLRLAPRKVDLFVQKLREHGATVAEEAAIVRLFPRRFEVMGHVVVVKLNSGVAREEFSVHAKAFAESFFPRVIDVVLLDTEGIAGELRLPKLEMLWANDTALITMPKESVKYALKQFKEPSYISHEDLKRFEAYTDSVTFTTHVENGIRYSFDVREVMFCSGNGTERMHFAAVNAQDEVVVDMFAGIGYFTLPLAMFGSVKVIYALEKNATSVGFLKYNALQNRVGHLVRTYCGDNREVASELCGQCDRVLMGYIPSCAAFLPRAISFLRRSPHGDPVGTIHYHFLSEKKTAVESVKQHIRAELGERVASLMRLREIRTVKSYAPKFFHHVADFCFEAS
ncbi:tRNA wybutosine-synthesizing protein 2 [Trypanosoma rangeli]|uniref:tRNA wybutosine-synthesizing protein 2 n=1 Tax=Trypanosoma rangeli TaxID=5698 RepID=A0A422N7F4_TRYRA|nr:tRNA wybutosine-synthesizing protein 2 [Trypanosoma rangeli]RNF01424.1 tRNA wybutosine-synthesizing protein 2 [Trypanosoma rangeli]|eukprot:RNF01424.1 tRNA wybutosine-synthesizing protein 2 [Trypanosoma rangeli]